MNGAYNIVQQERPDDLVNAVNKMMAFGWVPLGAPFQGARKGSKVDAHRGGPKLYWFQAMVRQAPLPMTMARNALAEEEEHVQGPGRQAMSMEEYEEAQQEEAQAAQEPGEREPITVVAGMGRCGTSLVMKMLAAGGMPTPGAQAPGYERTDIRDAIERGDYSWCPELAGGALKMLGLCNYHLPPPDVWPCRVIYLCRNHDDQARSWLEYRLRLAKRPNPPLMAMFERPKDEAGWLADEVERLERTDKASLEYLEGAGHVWGWFWLELIKENPDTLARMIAEFCGLPDDVVPAMAACVLPEGEYGHVPA